MNKQDATRTRTLPLGSAGSSTGIYLPPRTRFYTGAVRVALSYSKPFWFGASAVTAVMIVFGTVNVGSKQPRPHLVQQASLVPMAGSGAVKETVVYRAAEQRQSFKDRWETARVFFSEAESDELQAADLSVSPSQASQSQASQSQASPSARAPQTVRAKNANSLPRVIAGADTGADANVGALAFAPPSGPATFNLASASSEPISREAIGSARETTGSLREAATSPEARLGKLDEVERYLWEVYQRAPVKKDGSGDFTWKDPVAAKRFGISMPAYVISGMDADFREQLYHAGKAMDAAGVRWAILSAFRDDYRQSLASGFKASARNSLHGGSARVGGYGHGRAVDVTSEDNNPEQVWKWLDQHGAKYGLHRPMPGNDPAHVQSRGDWRKLAQALRASRVQIAENRDAKAKAKVATASAR